MSGVFLKWVKNIFEGSFITPMYVEVDKLSKSFATFFAYLSIDTEKKPLLR